MIERSALEVCQFHLGLVGVSSQYARNRGLRTLGAIIRSSSSSSSLNIERLILRWCAMLLWLLWLLLTDYSGNRLSAAKSQVTSCVGDRRLRQNKSSRLAKGVLVVAVLRPIQVPWSSHPTPSQKSRSLSDSNHSRQSMMPKRSVSRNGRPHMNGTSPHSRSD